MLRITRVGSISEAGKCLFRADNVWWRCTQYNLLLHLVARCLETWVYMAPVCFMSVVVTVWMYVGILGVYQPFLKIVFLVMEYWSMLYVCVRGVMLSVVLWRVELLVLVYGKYECFVMQMLYVCVCAHPVVVLNDALCMTSSF